MMGMYEEILETMKEILINEIQEKNNQKNNFTHLYTPDIFFIIGTSYYYQGIFDKSNLYFSKVLQKDPSNKFYLFSVKNKI